MKPGRYTRFFTEDESMNERSSLTIMPPQPLVPSRAHWILMYDSFEEKKKSLDE